MIMVSPRKISPQVDRLQALAEFRHQLRMFLRFSEAAAQKLGLEPQHHQLLLQVAGAPSEVQATIGYVAQRLGLRHNTAVELVNRCEEKGLVLRRHDGTDRRCVLLDVTPKGREMLEALSIDHAEELNDLAPRLIRTLSRLKAPRSETKASIK